MGGAIGGFVEETIRSFGLWGVAGLMLLENLFPPIPSELVLTLAGFFVSRGALGFAGALLAATVGSLLGAFVLYGLGRLGGRPLVLRYGSLLRVKQSDLDRADGWFHRHGGWMVFLGRLLPGVRSLVSIPAGVSEMPLGQFTLLTASGTALWNALLIGAGWYLGENWQRVVGLVGSVSNVVLAVALAAAVGLAVRWWRRKRVRG
ncbi:MAG: DedA family protein [Rubrobacter sp.]